MIKKNKYILLFIILVCLIGSCTNEIDIAQFEDERKLVVESSFTDELKVQEVRLFFTGSVAGGARQPLTGATVRVSDNEGLVIPMQEVSPGVYQSTEAVRGEQGKSYSLSFEIDGRNYVSAFEEMPARLTIDAIEAQRVDLAPEQETDMGLASGLLFTVDALGTTEEEVFTRIQWRDASRVVVPYPSRFTGSTGFRQINPRPSPLDTCYSTSVSTDVLLSNSLGNANSAINGFGLSAFRFSELQFVDRYLIETTINSVSRSAYDYYESLQSLTDGAGTLFDIQQGEVFGNVRREEDGEFILGYFEVAAVTREVQSFDLNEIRLANNEESGFMSLCPVSEVFVWQDGSLSDFFEAADLGGDIIEKGRRAPFRVYDFDAQPPPWGTAYLRLASCTDCRFFGNRSRPDYWVD